MTTETAPFTPTQPHTLITPKNIKNPKPHNTITTKTTPLTPTQSHTPTTPKNTKNSKPHNTMTTETAPFTPTQSRTLVTPKGTERGKRFLFIGTQTASELRAALKAKGVSGRELTEQVNDVLRGSATLGQQLAHAFVVEQSKRGVVWEYADALKGSAMLKGRVVSDKASKAKPAPSIEEAIDSMSEEQAMAFVAKLSAKFGA